MTAAPQPPAPSAWPTISSGLRAPAGIADGRIGLARRADRYRSHGEVLGVHPVGVCDQRDGILVEHRAAAGIEAGDDLVEAPVDRVLGGIAVLVEVDEELHALDRARLVEGAVALLVEIGAGAVHRRHAHEPAAEAALGAAQAIARLAAAERGDLLRIRHEVVHGRRRLSDAGLL